MCNTGSEFEIPIEKKENPFIRKILKIIDRQYEERYSREHEINDQQQD